MVGEGIRKELKRGNTTIYISDAACVHTPEEVEAILARIAAQAQPELARQGSAEENNNPGP